MHNIELISMAPPVTQTLTFTVVIEVAGKNVVDVASMEKNIAEAIDYYMEGGSTMTPEEEDNCAVSVCVECIKGDINFMVELQGSIFSVYGNNGKGFHIAADRMVEAGINIDDAGDVKDFIMENYGEALQRYGMGVAKDE